MAVVKNEERINKLFQMVVKALETGRIRRRWTIDRHEILLKDYLRLSILLSPFITLTGLSAMVRSLNTR